MLILGVLPSLIICNIKFNRRQWLSSLVRRAISIVLSLTMVAVGIWSIFFDLGPIFHERKELTYLITPFNYLISSADAYRRHHMITTQKIPLGNDAHIPKQPHAKPRLILLVVGETVRASNWGLNGYTRQTTPELAKRQVFNFNQVSSCGTTTAISLPCMFSPYGFHSYNQRLINQSESLLHVLWHAKVSVLWRDNQSGCKNVCTNLPYEIPNSEAFCKNGKCFDEVLLHQLKDKIDIQKNNQLIVLHMIGNHGPAYFERYPPQFNHWQPTCDTSDLANCTKESIVNTYDNVILYTDHILSNLIDILLTIQSHDTGLIYLSDHGESLGENNLVLHGLPYFIAPKEQKNIPLMIWLSNGLTKQLDLQKNCLSKKLSDQISHDYLFSTVLALFNVKTTVYDPKYDLIHSCQITKNTTNPLTQEVL
jgi:lipid A ethanolaminephosphotransferase